MKLPFCCFKGKKGCRPDETPDLQAQGVNEAASCCLKEKFDAPLKHWYRRVWFYLSFPTVPMNVALVAVLPVPWFLSRVLLQNQPLLAAFLKSADWHFVEHVSISQVVNPKRLTHQYKKIMMTLTVQFPTFPQKHPCTEYSHCPFGLIFSISKAVAVEVSSSSSHIEGYKITLLVDNALSKVAGGNLGISF